MHRFIHGIELEKEITWWGGGCAKYKHMLSKGLMYKSAGKRCGGTLLPCLYRAGALCEAAAEEREGGNSPSSPGKGRAPLRRGQTRWLPAISFHTSKAAGGRGETLERRLPASRHLPLPHRGGVAAPSQPGGGGGGRPRSPCRVPVPPLTPPHRPCCRSACSPPSPAAPRPPPLLLRRASVSVPVSVSVSVPAASPSPPPWRPRSSLRASPRRSRLHGNRR